MKPERPAYCESDGSNCVGCERLAYDAVLKTLKSARKLPVGVEPMTAEELASRARAVISAEYPASRLDDPAMPGLYCDNRREVALDIGRQVAEAWLERAVQAPQATASNLYPY